LGTKGQHATPRPPKSLWFLLLLYYNSYCFYISIMSFDIKVKKTFLDKLKQQRNVCIINN
jgi:hypothetical protein